MSKLPQNFRERVIFYFSVFISSVSFVIVFGFVFFQAYVRWTQNQNFTFLGGNELEALTLGAFALLLCLAYCYRVKRSGE